MAKKGYGNDQLLNDVRELADDNGRLLDPVKKLAEKSGLSTITIRGYLNTLAEGDEITIEYGKNRGRGKEIVACALTDKNAAEQPSKPIPPAPIREEPRAQPSPGAPPPIDRHITTVVALVDFDGLRNTGVTEFSRLHRLIAERGQILFSDAYLSSNSYRPDTATMLWTAGFRVIVCDQKGGPGGTHPRIRDAAIQYLSNTPVDHLLLVTNDLALDDLIAPLRGKTEVEMGIISPGDFPATPELEKSEPEPAPRNHQVTEFSAVLPMVSNQKTPRTDPEHERTKLLRAIIKNLGQRERSERGRKRGFIFLLDYVWERCRHEFRSDRTEVRAALQALVENQVLTKQTDGMTNSYSLNHGHVAVKGFLGSQTGVRR